jgi:hypothetical protein
MKMESSKHNELVKQVRESGDLKSRLNQSQQRISVMCRTNQAPSMSIPVQWSDDDFFITTTLRDAVEGLEGYQDLIQHHKEHHSEVCVWKFDDNNSTWDTSCKTSIWLEDGDLEENGYKYCPRCGKNIQEQGYEQHSRGLTQLAPDLGWVCGKCKTVNDEERSLCGFCDTPRLSG